MRWQTIITDLQPQVAAVIYHQMDSPLHLYQHQKLQLHLVAFDALSKETYNAYNKYKKRYKNLHIIKKRHIINITLKNLKI